MKINWNNKYTTISMYSFIVISASLLLYLGITQIDMFEEKIQDFGKVLSPFFIGGSLAYLLNFILNFYEKKVLCRFKNLSKKNIRILSLTLTYLNALLIIYLFIQFVLPQLVESIVGLANNIPGYINQASIFIEKSITDLNLDTQVLEQVVGKWDSLVNNIINIVTNMVPFISNIVVSIMSSIWNILLGFIVSIYILIDKEKFIGLSRKIIFAFFNKEYANRIIVLSRRSNETFGKFISGKIIDSAIIAVITFVILTLFKMPYTLLISIIIGITNIIPFFGPFIGAIPGFIIILFVSPTQALIFLGIVLFIQQVDGNIIGPKILGDSIGIGAFWILFSLMIFSKLLGFIGMIVGVPIFAIIYSIIKEIVEDSLERKGLSKETNDYIK